MMDQDLLSDPVLAATSIDTNTQTILLHASNHDLEALKPLLRIPGNASVQDPETGFTPLHAAIAACGPAVPADPALEVSNNQTPVTSGESAESAKEGDAVEEESKVDLEKARATVKELFLSGAIWNDLDNNDETPGCLAWRLGQRSLYELCVEAGVRAELLLDLMGDYEPLAGEDSEDDDVEDTDMAAEDGQESGKQQEVQNEGDEVPLEAPSTDEINPATYLSSNLTFTPSKLLDASSNGVMMSWETDIMRKSAEILLRSFSSPTSPLPHGPRILNIGFGMGIIDTIFHESKPAPHTHHIVEAHPDVLKAMEEAFPPSPMAPFNPAVFPTLCPPSTPSAKIDPSERPPSYTIHQGRWQEILLPLLLTGQTYDAIYFDTFSEPYSSLKYFFTEMIPGLLAADGQFSFFNGMGADRRVCYDVYCKKVEMDLYDAGLEVEWSDVHVDMEGLGEERQGEWEGVKRRYWTLETYRLPVCRFLG